jgi:hypothetical protein
MDDVVHLTSRAHWLEGAFQLSIAKFAGVVLAIGYSVSGTASELQQDTIGAWDQYVHGSDLHVRERAAGKKAFLWVDDFPDRAAHLRRGEIIIAPLAGHGNQSVPNGLIHHWIGAVFIPHATLASLLNVVNDFDRYKEIYRPLVVESALIACTEQEQEYSMVWRHHVLMVDATARGQYRTELHSVDAKRAYGITNASRIQEIQAFGERDQRLLAPDTGSGFIWRIRSVSRFEQRDGGVYLEIEALALTRDIPASLRWLVSPVVNHLSVNALKLTLRQTRDAVRSTWANGNRLCPMTPTNAVSVASASRGGVSGFQAGR